MLTVAEHDMHLSAARYMVWNVYRLYSFSIYIAGCCGGHMCLCACSMCKILEISGGPMSS